MKLMKKMSTFVVALTFLFVFSIKANAAETYKVGDKVIFGDFGGHVIEDSDSNSNTVKVYVDGWNKTPEEWQIYWTNKFINSEGYINYSDIDMVGIIKNSVKNKDGLSVSPFKIGDLNSVINIKKYEPDDPYNYWYYTESSLPSWLSLENYNFYGPMRWASYSLFSSSVETKYVFNEKESRFRGEILLSVGTDLLSKSSCEKYKYSACELFDKIDATAVIHGYDNGIIVGQPFASGQIDYTKEEDLFYTGNDLTHEYVAQGSYIVVTLDKSNLTIEKCDDYSESYKITYETNGGEKIGTATVSGNKDLAIPKREGYIFDGWYTDSNYSTKISSITPTQKMKDSCLAGYNDVTVYAKWKKELTSDKVSVLGEEKSLENVSSIAVKLLDKVTANIVGTLKTFTAYDITLKDADGKSVEPSGKVKLSLEIPKDYDKNNIGVYREDGEKLIEYTATINGEYAEIETDHFSTYIVGEKAEVKEEEKTTTKVTNETTSKDDTNIQNPKTGDNMTIFFIVGILLVGGIAIVLRKLKTVK